MADTGIGITDDKRCGTSANHLDERPHLSRTEGTIQSYAIKKITQLVLVTSKHQIYQ